MLTLLHISDLHFGPPFLPQVGEALLRIAPQLAADVIVISGDLTQRAKRQQFAEAQQFMQRLPDVPQVVVPGNHDVPLYRVYERLLDPHRHYRDLISPQLDRVWWLDKAVIVALDSTAPRRAIVNGRVRADQVDLCRETFAQAGDLRTRIVVVHHHFAPAPDYERDRTLPKSKQTVQAFAEMGVDLVLGGHLHRGYITNACDLVPSTANAHHGVMLVQCGTTTSRRGRAREKGRNSFNLVTITAHELTVTRYHHFPGSDSFEPISRHVFARGDQALGGEQ